MSIDNGGAILIIDDDPDALTILANALEHHGYRTFLARNGEAGIEVVKQEWKHIDCIVLDIMMPGRFDGYVVMEKLKEDEKTAEIPVLVLSALSSAEDIAKSYDAGAFQHLCKPCDITHLSAIIKNIVRLRSLERHSFSSASKYQAIIDNSPIQIAVISEDQSIVEMNKSFREAFTNAKIGGNFLECCFDEIPQTPEEHPVLRAFGTGAVEQGRLSIAVSGQIRHLDIRAAPITNDQGEISSIIEICLDITEQIELEKKLRRQVDRYNRVLREQDRTTDYLIQAQKELQIKSMELEKLSITDGLTGLSNRREFDRVIETEARRAGRYHHPLTLLMMDIDHFKAINDEHGHPVGDIILTELSEILCKALRETDTIARYGGEEFAIILPETDYKTGRPISERLRETIEAHDFNTPAGKLGVTVSIGTASICRQAINAQRLIAKADECLYKAKENGRNSVVGIEID